MEKTEVIRAKHTFNLDLKDLEHNPYPILKHLREKAPIAWIPSLEMWLITKQEDVLKVLQNPTLFSAETTPSFLRDSLGVNMLTLDNPAAKRLKDAMQLPFTHRGRVGEFVKKQFIQVADSLIDGFASDKSIELMATYAIPLSTIALQKVLGLETLTWQQLWDCCQGVCAGIANWENDPKLSAKATAAKAILSGAILEKIAAVRQKRDHSAISYMVHGAANLSEEEIINNVRLMISGGINEPRDGIGLAIWAASKHADVFETVRKNPRLWPKFINEKFRLYAPVGTASRQTTQAVVLSGVEIPAGDMVSAALGSANRDEAYWDKPEQFNINRKKPHFAFSTGAHKCLGMYLGYQTIVIGARQLYERLPSIRLNSEKQVNIHGFEFRGPEELWIEWD